MALARLKESGDHMHPFSPSTPMSDKDRISPYNIKTMLSRQVMRVKKTTNKEIICRYNTKFSVLQ